MTPASRTYLITQLNGCPLPHRELLVELLDALESRGGRRMAGSEAADLLGCRSRHTLRRMLRRLGMPRLPLIESWLLVLVWLCEWEREGITICAGAMRDLVDPAYRYRLVRRVTDRPWRTIRWVRLDGCLRLFAIDIRPEG